MLKKMALENEAQHIRQKEKNDVQKRRSKPTNITNYHKSEDKILIAFFKHKEDNKRMVKDGSYQRR